MNNPSEPVEPISIYFDTSKFTDEEIAKILSAMSDVYHNMTGDRLKIVGGEVYERPKAG